MANDVRFIRIEVPLCTNWLSKSLAVVWAVSGRRRRRSSSSSRGGGVMHVKSLPHHSGLFLLFVALFASAVGGGRPQQ